MFVRQKKNKSGVVSIQVIDKSSGKYKLLKTIGSSNDFSEIEEFVVEARYYIKETQKLNEFDFSNSNQLIQNVLENITALKLSGIDLVLGKIFDEIGFNKIEDNLFKDLVLYRLVYPKSKLKTTEYLYRFSQKQYSEDDVYRYLDKLHSKQKERVQQISGEFNNLTQQMINIIFVEL